MCGESKRHPRRDAAQPLVAAGSFRCSYENRSSTGKEASDTTIAIHPELSSPIRGACIAVFGGSGAETPAVMLDRSGMPKTIYLSGKELFETTLENPLRIW